MKKGLIYIFSVCAILFTSCTEYDNYDAPGSTLTGKVHYQGSQIGLRNSGVGFELWQDGYELSGNIPVYIAQDGTYSATLFNGQYKLVRKANGPWVNETSDTLIVNVNGNTQYDVEVKPHFIVGADSYQINMTSKTIVGTFTVDEIVGTSNLSNVRMFIGPRIILDNNIRGSYKKAEVSDVTFGQPLSITMDITDDLISRGYLNARIGVKAAESEEYIYTQVKKIELK